MSTFPSTSIEAQRPPHRLLQGFAAFLDFLLNLSLVISFGNLMMGALGFFGTV